MRRNERTQLPRMLCRAKNTLPRASDADVLPNRRRAQQNRRTLPRHFKSGPILNPLYIIGTNRATLFSHRRMINFADVEGVLGYHVP